MAWYGLFLSCTWIYINVVIRVNFLMLAIKYGQASIVIPIANMSFMVALFVSLTVYASTF